MRICSIFAHAWLQFGSPQAALTIRRCTSIVVSLAFLFAPVTPMPWPVGLAAQPTPPPAPHSGCDLNSFNHQIQHVIYIQFDNVDFRRDNPNVRSDLEQMPHLLNFLKNNGTLLTNHHTPLIAHTADDIIT